MHAVQPMAWVWVPSCSEVTSGPRLLPGAGDRVEGGLGPVALLQRQLTKNKLGCQGLLVPEVEKRNECQEEEEARGDRHTAEGGQQTCLFSSLWLKPLRLRLLGSGGRLVSMDLRVSPGTLIHVQQPFPMHSFDTPSVPSRGPELWVVARGTRLLRPCLEAESKPGVQISFLP